MSQALRLTDEDCLINVTAAAAYTGGEVVQLADGRAAVYPRDVVSGELGAASTEGQFTVLKTVNPVWIDGGPIWWDHSANTATSVKPTAAGDRDFYLGTAVGDATGAATTGIVNLNVKPVFEIDLHCDAFECITVKTVVGSLTVEVPHIENQGGTQSLIFGATAEAQKLDLLSRRSFAVGSKWIVSGTFNIIDDGDAAAIDFNIGVANATHATDANSISERCLLHTDANVLDIIAWSTDGTTTVALTDTTVNYALNTPVTFVIDGRNLADIQIYIDGILVLGSTVFKLDAATGPLKLLAHLEKTSDDETARYNISDLKVRYAQQ